MTWRFEQPASYHAFADARSFLGIANAADTLSNAAFLLVGLLGLCFLWRESRSRHSARFAFRQEMQAWWLLFGALVLTGLGSAWYHHAPDDARLFWDRLPMSLCFAALVAITVSERFRPGVGRHRLPALLVLAAGSVLWWRATGNLLLYAIVQYGSMATVVAIVIRRRSRYTHGGYFAGMLALYAAAKAAEFLDGRVYALGGIASGHTLKHLLAAAGVACLLRMLMLRRPRRAGAKIPSIVREAAPCN